MRLNWKTESELERGMESMLLVQAVIVELRERIAPLEGIFQQIEGFENVDGLPDSAKAGLLRMLEGVLDCLDLDWSTIKKEALFKLGTTMDLLVKSEGGEWITKEMAAEAEKEKVESE